MNQQLIFLLFREILSLGRQIQFPQRVSRVPPVRLRLTIAGHQAQGNGSGRSSRSSALRFHTAGTSTVTSETFLDLSLC